MQNLSKNSFNLGRHNFYKQLKDNPLAYVSLEFAATVILIFSLFIFAIKPTILAIKAIQIKITDFENFNVKLKTKIETLETLTPQIQNNSKGLELLDKAIPLTNNFETLEKQIRYLLWVNNLKINSLDFSNLPIIYNPITEKIPNDPAKPNNSNQQEVNNFINYKLSASGDYNDIKNFLSQIQNLIRISHINSVSIEKGDSTTGRANLSLKLDGQVYFIETTMP